MSNPTAEDDNVQLIRVNNHVSEDIEMEEQARENVQLQHPPAVHSNDQQNVILEENNGEHFIRLSEREQSSNGQQTVNFYRHKEIPFWKKGPGWQFWVLTIQTLFIFAKLQSNFILTFIWMWIWDWWVILLPSWIAITGYTFSLIMWIIRDGYKWRKSHQRFQRRLRRHEARMQQIQATLSQHGQLQVDYVRSARSERRMLRKRVDRFYAYSILIGICLLIVSLFALTLRLNMLVEVSILPIVLPLIAFGFLHSVIATILLGFMWKQSARNGGHYAIKNRAQTVFVTFSTFILLSSCAILFAQKIDHQISEVELSYGACLSPLFVFSGIAWLCALCMLIFSFYDRRLFLDMFKVHRNRLDDEEEADINRHLERIARSLSVEERKHITTHRLDIIVFMLMQIPFNVFLVQLISFLNRAAHDPIDIIILFIGPFVGEIIGCTWIVTRDSLVKLAYRNVANEVTSPVQDSNVGIEPSDPQPQQAAPQAPANEQISINIAPRTVELRHERRNISPFMLLYLRSVLNDQSDRGGASAGNSVVDQRTNITLLEWLQELQQHDMGAHFGSATFRRPQGVSEDFLSVLPTFEYEKKTQIHERLEDRIANVESCSICLSDYENNESLRTLPCFHIFHKECVDDWLKQSKLCPVCKHQVDALDNENTSL